MAKVDLSPNDIQRLRALAVVLIAETDAMPSPANVEGYDAILVRAVAACGHSPADIAASIEALADRMDWTAAEALARNAPALFAIASQIVSAAYYMAPAVLAALGFPEDRRHPAEVEEFVEEYETGIFDPVVNSLPRYRDIGVVQKGNVP